MDMHILGKKSNQQGFTLIEFMIASVIFMVVMSSGSDFFNNMNRSAVVNSELTDVQQDIRAAMLTLVRDISMAGYGTTSASTCTNAITPTNLSTGPDQISMASMGNVLTTLTVAAAPGDTKITVASALTAGTISINGIKTTTAAAGTNPTISPAIDASGEGFPIGTQILNPTCVEYDVNTGTRELSRSVGGVASVLASGVLDMQFAYALDADGDNLIDDANLSGGFDTGDFVNTTTDPASIRLVRVSLFVQTNQSDDRYINGAAVTLEDHDPTGDAGYTLAAYQPFRSRVLTRIVRPHNIGLP